MDRGVSDCPESWPDGCDAWGAPHPFHGCKLVKSHPGDCQCACGHTNARPANYRPRHTGRPGDARKPQAACGTHAGYYRHRDRNERPCDACLAAKAAYQRQRTARKAS